MLLCATASAVAQDGIFRLGDAPGTCTVREFRQSDSSVFICCTYHLSDDSASEALLNVPADLSVYTEGEEFRLLHSYNIPEYDESKVCYAVVGPYGNDLNFALEFEKFPLDTPFEVVGDYDDVLIAMSEVSGKVSSSETLREFLSATPCIMKGSYVFDGTPHAFFDSPELRVGFKAFEREMSIEWYQSVGMEIVNRTDHNITVSGKDIQVSAFRQSGDKLKKSKIKLLSKDACDSAWREGDVYSVMQRDSVKTTVAEGLGGAMINVSSHAPSSGASAGLFLLGLAISASDRTDYDAYLVEENKIRVELMKQYLVKETIAPGEVLDCFVSFKIDERQSEAHMSILIDGREYTFDW